jgi:hypothetical protein
MVMAADQSDLLQAAFEAAVHRALGERIKADEWMARAMWSALANIDWRHEDGVAPGFTFRGAGAFIAEIRGSGDYVDWYCSGPDGTVTEEIEKAMLAEGWTWEPVP